MITNFEAEKKLNKGSIAMYVQDSKDEYQLSDEGTFPTDGYELNVEKSSCTNGGTLSQNAETKKINVKITNNVACTLYFDIEKKSLKTLKHLGLTSNGVKTNFDDPATTDEGVFEMEDDYGTSYYYRGAVTNNYVKFAGFYWRIIRVNGDGSLRISYDGTNAYSNGGGGSDKYAYSIQVYNANNYDNKYLGWMYGPEGTRNSTSKDEAQSNTVDSDIKVMVDKWYKTNIADKGYSSAVADVIFCNDRSTPGQSATGLASDTGLGYGTKVTAFGATARTGVWNFKTTNSAPTFKCPQKNDAFTVTDITKGNGALTYPVGLITADEVVAAGSGKYGTTNQNYYLYRGSGYYWTLSPYHSNGSTTSMIDVHSNGGLRNYNVNNGCGVIPVISLSSEYINDIIGTGTMTDPYRASDVAP